MNPAANPALSLRLPEARARVLLGMVLCGFMTLGGRALYLQVLKHEDLQARGQKVVLRVLELPAHRGMITDRYGEPLAISTPMESVYASPVKANLSAAEQHHLASLLGLDDPTLARKLADKTSEFVYLKRHLPPDVAAQVVHMGLQGVGLRREYRRYYPEGEVMAHVLGFTDIDDVGREGMELAFQEQLAGHPGSRRVIQDRRGRVVEDVVGITAPADGRDIALSVDRKLQYLAYRELRAAVLEHHAKAGGLVMLDVRTGEILALANLPAYNPNNRSTLDPQRSRNRAVTDLFEPGSTMKPFTVASALTAGVVRPDTIIQTAPGVLRVGDATIHDAHAEGALTVAQVIQKSSNVGAAKIALALPAQTLWNTLSAAGFGHQPHSGFPGEVSGRLRPYASWQPIEQATMAYGHGISASLLQLARAYTVFATDGELRSITLLRREVPPTAERVLEPRVALAVRQMLEMVVQPGGTAIRAQVAGYRVAGKTGTAHKLEGRSYSRDHYVSSFVGLAPASNARLLVAVMIDEPAGGAYYGGTVAAPVFSRVMGEALRLLAVPPDAPNTGLSPLEGLPDVGEDV